MLNFPLTLIQESESPVDTQLTVALINCLDEFLASGEYRVHTPPGILSVGEIIPTTWRAMTLKNTIDAYTILATNSGRGIGPVMDLTGLLEAGYKLKLDTEELIRQEFIPLEFTISIFTKYGVLRSVFENI